MPWWTEKDLHPKTKGRFFVTFSNNFFLPNVKSTSKPSMTVDMKEYQLINHQFKYPGIVKWNDVTIKFVDMNGNGNAFDTADLLWQMLNNTGYAYPYLDLSQIRLPHYTRNVDDTGRGGGGHHIATTRNDFRTITTPEKSSTLANSFGRGLTGKADFDGSGTFKQRVAIYQISPDGVLTECWYLANPQIKSINFGDLAYESDDLVEYEMVVSYDWAVLDSTLVGTDASQITQAGENAYEEFRKAALERKDQFAKRNLRLAGDISTNLIDKTKEQIESNNRIASTEGTLMGAAIGDIAVANEYQRRVDRATGLQEADAVGTVIGVTTFPDP